MSNKEVQAKNASIMVQNTDPAWQIAKKKKKKKNSWKRCAASLASFSFMFSFLLTFKYLVLYKINLFYFIIFKLKILVSKIFFFKIYDLTIYI